MERMSFVWKNHGLGHAPDPMVWRRFGAGWRRICCHQLQRDPPTTRAGGQDDGS